MADTPRPSFSLLHRRPAYAVNAPALLRHLCFRAKESIEAPSADLAKLNHTRLIDELNATLIAIQDRCDAAERVVYVPKIGPPRADESLEIAQVRTLLHAITAKAKGPRADGQPVGMRAVDPTQTLLIRLPRMPDALSDWRARMCVDLHGEYFAVTCILDQFGPESKGVEASATPPMPGDRDKPDYSAALLRTVAQEMSRLANEASHDNGERQHTNYGKYLDWWYREIWDRFDAHAGGLDASSAELFAEFYGLAMQVSPATRQGPEPSPPHDDIIATPQHRVDGQDERLEKLFKWVNTNRDFVREVLQLDPVSDGVDQDANCVLCTMMWGAAVYGSSLGGRVRFTQDKIASARHQQAPLQYFVVSHSWSRYLLGRSLRRLQALGELRSAAVLDLPILDRASERMRALRNQIDNKLDTRDAARNSATLGPKDLRTVQGTLNEIADSEIAGGLLARVGRSRHYAQEFKQRMTDMGFERIDGWEPYDIFMHRNLFKTLEYIDGIGHRFATLSATVQRLTAARNLHEVAEVERDIVYIQRIGEIIGWTAFAYYGGQILDKFLWAGPKFCSLCSVNVCQIFHAHWGTVITSFAAIGAFFYFRFRKSQRDKEQ